ncbi:ABC transporter ATP-binding protein [Arcobacter cloacae]|uniref:Iron ABC transporter ATP-binding protein n=1 Tax=Arcobacter cloacae TaxID=1054034 RepID=A0A4Q0ZA64_9BACT|nr:ABC transporter ATP-binding protein [Arcobacter cloacae]NCB11298.1 ABC transporter ATP-binding protein [Erysipelotrichia bacterium]QKF89820.1 iron siderophore ABC transporter, ATP-binding protein [Arcobacter cloacae]RXI37430.1 iron ABC transporter ATP-binding protein [Arcobacter cloacae]RXJ83009.1 iron ABC transporter ATP-binding protein [Arcobacter cloacae]
MLEIKDYNSSILHEISFHVKQNENLIILGENGAGKSTLAKVLSNLISNEKVKLFGENISKISDFKRAKLINYIPPKLSIFDEYVTLREFLELSFISSVDNQKVDEIIKLLNLKKLEDKYCKSFSSGEKQLLLLASAIIHDAKITIFDELTANLDISRLKEVYDIFNSDLLQQKIIITHNLDLAYALKYKVLFLNDGIIEFFGEHEEFFSNENLKRFYNNTIIKLDKHLVVNL